MVNIGIDFDGVILDPIDAKIKLAKEQFGLKLTPENACRKKIIALGVSPAVYDQTFRRIALSDKRYELNPLPFAKKIINRLYRNHKIYVITSRNDAERFYIQDWTDYKKIKYHIFINTSDESKNRECIENKIDIYIDDDVHKLEQITNSYTHLYLLTRPYNKHVDLIGKRITRVTDWNDFYKRIKYLL